MKIKYEILIILLIVSIGSVNASAWQIEHSKAQGGTFVVQDLTTGETIWDGYKTAQSEKFSQIVSYEHNNHDIIAEVFWDVAGINQHGCKMIVRHYDANEDLYVNFGRHYDWKKVRNIYYTETKYNNVNKGYEKGVYDPVQIFE